MLHLSVPDINAYSSDSFVPSVASLDWNRAQEPSRLKIVSMPEADLLIIRKTRPGLAADDVAEVRRVLADLRQNRSSPCKFLVFEIGDDAAEPPAAAIPGALLDEIADLVVDVPVVPVAWARGPVGAIDLELALACSMMVAEPNARFSFDLDLVQSLRTYSVLAHKIGFARAERLMEGAAELTATQMSDLLLLNAIVPSAEGLEAIVDFVRSRARRHNAACGIYRAQRRALQRG